MFDSIREESRIFKDLEELCKSSGYIHAIAYFSFRDNFYRASDNDDGEINISSNTQDFLVRTEINTLIVLALKGDFITDLPSPETMDLYLKKTTELLNELHLSLVKEQLGSITFAINQFNALDDFNPITAYPIIKLADNSYLLIQCSYLHQALYETPFFWFNNDKGYKSKLAKNRGKFTEQFSVERLVKVFGREKVFANVLGVLLTCQ